MNYLRTAAAGLLGVLALAGTGHAQHPGGSARGLEARSTIGWTSNAEGAAGGGGDLYHTHLLSARANHTGPGFGLRGSVQFETTRYRRLSAENDWSFGVGVEAEYALSASALLKLEAGLDYGQEGTLIQAAPLTLAAITPDLKGRLGLDYVRQWGATTLTLGAAYQRRQFGKTRFDHPLLTSVRTRAHVAILGGRIHAEHRLGRNVAVNALAQVEHGRISQHDSALFGRLGATVVRLGTGIAANYRGRASFALGGGADLVFAEDGVVRLRVLPYGEADISLGLTDRLTLRAGFATTTDMIEPADGYLDWLIDSRASLVYALSDAITLEPALFAGARMSVGFETGIERNWGAEIEARAALSDNFSLSGTLSHKRVLGLAPAYSENRAALMLAFAI